MAGDAFTYSRPKSATTNSTAINVTVKAGEQGGTIADGDGDTAIVEAQFLADVDESGGTSLKKFGTFVITPVVSSTGAVSFEVEFTPTNGDGVDGTAQSYTFAHPNSMDVIQTAGGRARQS